MGNLLPCLSDLRNPIFQTLHNIQWDLFPLFLLEAESCWSRREPSTSYLMRAVLRDQGAHRSHTSLKLQVGKRDASMLALPHSHLWRTPVDRRTCCWGLRQEIGAQESDQHGAGGSSRQWHTIRFATGRSSLPLHPSASCKAVFCGVFIPGLMLIWT